ncbi:hypothetical protein C4J81_15450 [Deltaproteobacteria bacterium Smac51]|nr:hypothetical protein C4J81_10185 [Deltaproteobacteria bacterium Smac51]UQZ90526.1 hypothetical protein C4J81_15450 [Deltaproteobacteria bacterium Smac51]
MGGGETLTALVEMIGLEKTLFFLSKRGGECVYFPSPENLSPDHWLSIIVGFDAAMRLCEVFQGQKVALPLGPETGNRSTLQKAVQESTAAGASVNEIVRATGLHSSTVRRIRNRRTGRTVFTTRTDPRQQNLFADLYDRHDKE